MSRWHSYDVASISFNRSIYSRRTIHRDCTKFRECGCLAKCSGTQRTRRILKVIADKLISIRWNVFRRNCFRSGSPTCANLRCLHILLKRWSIWLRRRITGIILTVQKQKGIKNVCEHIKRSRFLSKFLYRFYILYIFQEKKKDYLFITIFKAL